MVIAQRRCTYMYISISLQENNDVSSPDMPFWKRVRDRASDLARRVRSRVTRSAASSFVGAGRRLSAVGNGLLGTLPPSPRLPRQGPVRSNSSESVQFEESAPRGGFHQGIQTNPDLAWGSTGARPRDPVSSTPFRVYRDPELRTPKSGGKSSASRRSSGRSSCCSGRRSSVRRRLKPGQDGHPGRSWFDSSTNNPVACGLSQYAESSVLSQYHTANSSATWYQSSQQDPCRQGIDWGSDESSSDEEKDYENVVSGIQCRYCGAKLLLTFLSLRESVSRYADYFVER